MFLLSLDLAHSSLEEASQDLYTGGLDVIVVTPREIVEFGSEIKSEIDEAKTKSISRLKRRLMK